MQFRGLYFFLKKEKIRETTEETRQKRSILKGELNNPLVKFINWKLKDVILDCIEILSKIIYCGDPMPILLLK